MILNEMVPKDTENSWVWHPFHGTFLKPGYGQHYLIFNEYPDLYVLPEFKDGEETEVKYDCPRGYVRISFKDEYIMYTRYDRTKYGIRGGFDRVDVCQLDEVVSNTLNLPDFPKYLYGSSNWWHNLGTIQYAPPNLQGLKFEW